MIVRFKPKNKDLNNDCQVTKMNLYISEIIQLLKISRKKEKRKQLV